MDSTQHAGGIAVAVSGGADSLFSLIHLKEQGMAAFAVHGIFFAPRNNTEREEKKRVLDGLEQNCRYLDIPLHVIDLSKEFERLVIQPFVEAYARGLTPNPCALCNAQIKFGLLQDTALSKGAGMLATGHYARLVKARRMDNTPECGPALPALLQGKDAVKDQSYFLALTPIERLGRAIFPLGKTSKKEVLGILAERGIPVPQPGESQEVCFVPNDAYRDFLPRMAAELGIPLRGPGPMLLADGQCLGTHKGLWQYTEGQRRGLGIGWKEPLHVLGKEKRGNILRLGPNREMRAEGCVCETVNILLPPQYWPGEVLVKTRYREKPKPAHVILERKGQGMRIHFLQPDAAVAPGQVAAVYIPGGEDGEQSLRLVAGGLIREAL